MASVIGAAVVEKICGVAVEMAVRKLAEEAKLVVNFRKDFIWLNRELKYVMGFLQDAGQQPHQREDVKQWLEDIRVIVMTAEDIFEECAVESMYGNDAQSCGLSCSQWILRYRIGQKIKDIKARITSINQKGEQLKLVHEVVSADASTSESVARKRSSLLPSDSHPVGIQRKVDYMRGLLDNPAFPVIVVVGMGGTGKSYLLQHLYSNTRERYEKSIWLSVSQSYSIRDLQKDLAFQFDKDFSEEIKRNEVSEQLAAQLINEKLKGKSCLVVLDDVWTASREDDLLSKLGIPTTMNSPCKVVVTTRSRDVGTNLDAEIYEMEYLSEEESWNLFSFYAFREYERNRVPNQQMAREIVKQCGNLPLAIKTVAASLANTTIPWDLKLHQLKGIVTANVRRDQIMPVLRLSYDSLPAHLKACFAYLSFFPEDEKIECEYLINMWIGEGFIPAGEGQWDVSWECLYQLANLCLLQLWEEVSDTKGLIKYCKIHDLLYDLAIQISRENNCAFSVGEASTHTSGGTGCYRILLAKKHIADNAISEIRPVCRRTFSLSKNEGITSIPVNLFTAMRGLRVLDLSSTRISTLPASVGKMKLLKVLNLRRTDIREVPECVRHLKSLLFLAMCDRCSQLPGWISELKCLQHLECEGIDHIPKEISKLASLRTLRSSYLSLSIEEDEFMRLEDLANMTQLQELGLRVKHGMELNMREEGILAKLAKMRRLSIVNENRGVAHFPENMRALEHLESLRLESFAVPSWICDLTNLRELVLYTCECSDFPELQRMPNLVRLWLWLRCKELPKAFGKSGGFPSLRFLDIQFLYELEEFPELEEGAMVCLEEFYLRGCPKVKKVEGLERLKRLKKFSYPESGTNELRKMLKEGGEYRNKIKATNPEVNITERLMM